MAAIDNAELERYCQFRSASGTPGGCSRDRSIEKAIWPKTGTTEKMRFLALLGSVGTVVSDRLTELGGEVSP